VNLLNCNVIEELLTKGFAFELNPGVFLYIENEKRFIYIHHIERSEGNTEIYFAHTDYGDGNIQVDVFLLDDSAIVDYFEPCKIQYN